MASLLFFCALLTLVAADDRLLHYSLSVAELLSFNSSLQCLDSSVDSATNAISTVRCPYSVRCLQLSWYDENGNQISYMGCHSNPMFRRMIEEIDCVERYPPVNTGWAYEHLRDLIYVYQQGMIYYASIKCSISLNTPYFYKAMDLHALPPSLIPKDPPTTATSTTVTTTTTTATTTTTSPVDDNSTTPVLLSTTEAPTTATEAVNDDVRHEYDFEEYLYNDEEDEGIQGSFN